MFPEKRLTADWLRLTGMWFVNGGVGKTDRITASWRDCAARRRLSLQVLLCVNELCVNRRDEWKSNYLDGATIIFGCGLPRRLLRPTDLSAWHPLWKPAPRHLRRHRFPPEFGVTCRRRAKRDHQVQVVHGEWCRFSGAANSEHLDRTKPPVAHVPYLLWWILSQRSLRKPTLDLQERSWVPLHSSRRRD